MGMSLVSSSLCTLPGIRFLTVSLAFAHLHLLAYTATALAVILDEMHASI